MPKASSIHISQWKKLILEQMESDLSIPAWCIQKGIPIYNFRYWHKKLFPKALERSAFLEVADKQINIGVHLEYRGVKIYLEPQFDVQALQKCLEAIRTC